MKTDSAAVREVPASQVAHVSPFGNTCPACGVPLVVVIFALVSPDEVLLFSAREGETPDGLAQRIRSELFQAAREAGISTLDADRLT